MIYTNSEGRLHRLDGPANIRYDGTKEWHLNGFFHREGGPAVVYADGTEEWYRNGHLHRENGPAVTFRRPGAPWSNAWYQNGRLHRIDGPAIEYKDGSASWYINGIDISMDVNNWLEEQNITYPFNEVQQSFFIMKFLKSNYESNHDY